MSGFIETVEVVGGGTFDQFVVSQYLGFLSRGEVISLGIKRVAHIDGLELSTVEIKFSGLQTLINNYNDFCISSNLEVEDLIIRVVEQVSEIVYNTDVDIKSDAELLEMVKRWREEFPDDELGLVRYRVVKDYEHNDVSHEMEDLQLFQVGKPVEPKP